MTRCHHARILGSIRTRGSGVQRRVCGGGGWSCRRAPSSSGRCPRSPAGRFRAACGPYLPLSPGHHVPFALRPLASCRSRGGRLPEQGRSVFLWQFSPRCGILPHCFSGEAVHCPAVPVPFRREEKFRCQISPSSLSLPRWTGCLTRRCARS